jgi:hypothetical protein
VETLFHIALAIAALAVPLACAYVIVRRLGRRNAPHGIGSRERTRHH